MPHWALATLKWSAAHPSCIRRSDPRIHRDLLHANSTHDEATALCSRAVLAEHPVGPGERHRVALCEGVGAALGTHEALDQAGVSVDELDAFIPHQANLRITQTLARNIQLPDTVAVATDIVDTGNTSAASVPLAMEAMLRHDEASVGDTALLIAFGAGLSYAGQVVTLPPLA